MKVLTLILAALVLAIQYPLWIGKGSWMRVRDLDRQLVAVKASNAQLRTRNQAMDAEVRDLKEGSEAIEERARMELGMIRRDEIFYQVVTPGASPKGR
jgi:cell division protein FtsB